MDNEIREPPITTTYSCSSSDKNRKYKAAYAAKNAPTNEKQQPHSLQAARETYKMRKEHAKGRGSQTSNAESRNVAASSSSEDDSEQQRQQEQRQANVLSRSADAKQRRVRRKEMGQINDSDDPQQPVISNDPIIPGAFHMSDDYEDEDVMEHGGYLGSRGMAVENNMDVGAIQSYPVHVGREGADDDGDMLEQGKMKSHLPARRNHEEVDINAKPIAVPYHNESNLIEATLVEEEDNKQKKYEPALFIVAEPLVEQQQKRGFCQSRCCAIFVCVIFIVLIVGATVGVTNSKNSNDDDDGNARPSSPPTTASPTLQPTAFSFLDHLSEKTREVILFDPGSAQSRAYAWLQNDTVLAYDPQRMLQRFALATLYYATDGENWLQSDKWLSHEDEECYWHSGSHESDVNCEMFLTLSLPSNGLNGTVPEELELIPSLAIVTLSDNSLVGTLPTQLGQLSRLRKLELDQNQLSGPIPSEIGLLSNLRSLSAFSNMLEHIPTELGNCQQLTLLRLDDNSLKGTLVSELGMLQDLENLRLSSNSLSGSIPIELGRMTSLLQGHFANNAFTGSVPFEDGVSLFSGWTSMIYLNFNTNHLTGPLPTEIGMLSNMRTLLLSSNSFSNTLPSELGYLTTIGNLDMSNNLLSGEIPSSLTSLTRLSSLNVLNNYDVSYDNMNNIFDLCQMIDRFLFSLDCSSVTLPPESIAFADEPTEDDGEYYYRPEESVAMVLESPPAYTLEEDAPVALPMEIQGSTDAPAMIAISLPTEATESPTMITATIEESAAYNVFLLSIPIQFSIFYKYPQVQKKGPTPEELDGILYQTDLFFKEILQEFYKNNIDTKLEDGDFLSLSSDYDENQVIQSSSDGREISFGGDISFIIVNRDIGEFDLIMNTLSSEIQNLMLNADFDSYENYYVMYSEPFGTSIFFDIQSTRFQID